MNEIYDEFSLETRAAMAGRSVEEQRKADESQRAFERGRELGANRVKEILAAASSRPSFAAAPDVAPQFQVSYRGNGAPAQHDTAAENEIELRENTYGGAFRSAAEPLPGKEERRAASRRYSELADEQETARAEFPDVDAMWAAYPWRDQNRTARREQARLAAERAEYRHVAMPVSYELRSGDHCHVLEENVTVEAAGPLTFVSGSANAIAEYMRTARPSFEAWGVMPARRQSLPLEAGGVTQLPGRPNLVH